MNYISSLGIDRRSIWTALENKDCKVEVNCGEEIRVKEARPQEQPLEGTKEKRAAKDEVNKKARAGNGGTMAYEETILIDGDRNEKHDTKMRLSRPSIFGRLAQGLAQAVRTVISVVLAPGAFISGCFYDSKGRFSVTLPIKTAAYRLRLSKTGVSVQTVALPAASRETTKEAQAGQGQAELPRRRSSEPEGDLRPSLTNRPMLIDRRSSRAQSSDQDNPSRHTRSKSLPTSTAETGDPATPRRSIRISVLNEDALRQRRLDREKRNSVGSNTEAHLSSNAPLTAKSIKSPTSPASSLGLTKYPRVPAPPRPLVPRRQPSYSHTSAPVTDGPQKTLIIDLDETLIHSMSKGGRMSTGHMVEVKLQNPVGVEGASIGPQVPILYYVHKRPHCDEFLRKVSGKRENRMSARICLTSCRSANGTI